MSDENRKYDAISSEYITETGRGSRGGLKEYEEVKNDNVQRVRGEFLAATFKAKVTFSIDSLTFNSAYVRLFPQDQYIAIHVDKPNQRIIIEPCRGYERDSMKFANIKDNQNKPRKCLARILCGMIFEMMEWNPEGKYRIMAIYQEFGEKKIIVFNLDEAVFVFAETVGTENGTRVNRKTYMPLAWKDTFGDPASIYEKKNKIDFDQVFMTFNNKTGELRDTHIEAKLPTPEELIHRPYGGMRIKKEAGKDENE